MAHNSPNQEELHLRRRARRRLVGAIALALLAVVLLPMIFDPEPRPLGANVDIRIPEQEAPPAAAPADAVSTPATDQLAALAPPPAPALGLSPGIPAAVGTETVGDGDAGANQPEKGKPTASTTPSPGDAKAGSERRQAEAKAPVRPATTRDSEAAGADEQISEAAKPAAEKSGGYHLQLGSFANERYARQMIDKARVAGFKASAILIDGQYKVRVGPIDQRERALLYQEKLKSKGFKPVLVGP